MPAFYAHHLFGKKVKAAMDAEGDLAKVIADHRVQFDIGLQGPDIFFFYKPYIGGGRVAKYGHHLHEISALPFFEHAMKVLEKYGVSGGEYAYLLGFICHYILDSQCHGYINSVKDSAGVSHMEIEEEFEKFLLRREGEDPLRFPLGALVPQDADTARAIAPFFEGISPAEVKQSLADLRRVKQLFTAPGAAKQCLINSALKVTGHFDSLKGLMNQRKDNPKCIETSRELLRLYEEAVPVAAAMVKSFDESLRTGEQLSERFDRDFL